MARSKSVKSSPISGGVDASSFTDSSVLLGKVSTISKEDSVKALANMKLSVAETLDKISNEIVENISILSDIQNSIEIEKNNLKEIFNISAEAGALQGVIDQRVSLQKQWDLEKSERDLKWKREQEQYEYDQKILKTKDLDEWNARKAKRETDFQIELTKRLDAITIRENEWRAKEADYKLVKSQIDELTTNMASVIQKERQEQHDRLSREFNYEKNLMKKDAENEKKLADKTIATLTQRIAELESSLIEARRSEAAATARVQSIAEKAIEGAQKQVIITPNSSENSTSKGRN